MRAPLPDRKNFKVALLSDLRNDTRGHAPQSYSKEAILASILHITCNSIRARIKLQREREQRASVHAHTNPKAHLQLQALAQKTTRCNVSDFRLLLKARMRTGAFNHARCKETSCCSALRNREPCGLKSGQRSLRCATSKQHCLRLQCCSL